MKPAFTSEMVQRDEVRDIDLSIRFKNGRHTILLFVDPMAKFSQVREELLDVLRERYPDGLPTSNLPNEASQIKLAVPKNKTDPSQGWKALDLRPDDHPADKGFQDNMVVAFAIAADEEDDVDFEVEFPSYEEDEVDETEEASEL